MARYRLLIKPSALKKLEAFPRKDRRRVTARIHALAADPRPAGCEKLTGHDLYRVRQGDYRILYPVLHAETSVVVIKIGHRREVYRTARR